MTIYEQYQADWRILREREAAMTQPLDVAVFSVQTRLQQPYDHVPGAIQRHGYLRRLSRDESLSSPILAADVMERGS